MQKFQWPGYEMQLLGELQRQQNSAQFCDTLLQTEGISVPTHSCVLAALSPYLSQKLSASPAPPSGQKRRLQLQMVTAQTLLKVVGLLYSGELEVRGMKEQNEVLAAAHQFGIGDLILGCKDGGVKGGELLNGSVGDPIKNGFNGEETRHGHRNLKMQDAQVQFGISGRNENDPFAKKKSLVSVSTQTIEASVTSAFSPDLFSSQTPPALVATSLQPLHTPLIEQFSDAEPTEGQSPGTSLTSSSTLSTPLNDEPSFLRSQEENVSQQSSECGDGIASLNNKRQRQEDEKGNNKMTEDGGNAEKPGRVSGDEMVPEGVSKENRPSPVRTGGKNIETMKRMMDPTDTTQNILKVKLRRRTEEEAWEVVNMQNKDEAVSVLTSVEQGCSHQTGLTDVQNPAPPNSPLQNPETPNLHPFTTSSPKPPRHANISSDSEPRSNETLNQSSELDVEEPPQPQGPAEESEEAIDQMLEEIMMGLNILPNLYSNLKKAQTSHEGVPSFCQVPRTENESTAMRDLVHEAGCVFYQELGTQDGHSSADTGIHCCIGAQNQPSSSGPSAFQPDLVTQQQQRSEFSSSLRSSGRSEGMPSDRSEASLHPQAGSALSSACVSSKQTLHYQPPSSQRDHTTPGVSALSRENETRSDRTFSLPCMNDLRLPRCLSPLEHHSPKAQQRPNKSSNPENYFQPALLLQPWLTETPCSQQFSVSTLKGNKTTFLPRDAKTCCLSEQLLHQVGWKPENGDACAESSTVEEIKSKSTPVGKSDPKKRRKRRCDATGDAATPKKRIRKRKNFPQEFEGQFLAPKKLKVSDGTKTFCSVSLSCNSLLMKERQVATNPSNILSEKPNEKSVITACVEKKSRAFGNLSAEQTRIRTRGFVKKSQEKISDKIPEKCVLIPVVCRAVIENEQGVTTLPKRKRGRPRKIKLEQAPSNSAPDVSENMNQDPVSKQQMAEEGKERKKRCRKRRRNESKAGTGHLKETGSSGRSEKAEKDFDTKNKQSWMVTLKEFQKLIKRQHSKMKSTENEETNKSTGEDKKRVDESDKDDKMNVTESLTIQDQAVCDATVGENNQSVSTSAALCNKPHLDGSTGDLGPEDNPASFDDVQKEEVVKLSSESEQLVNNPEEAFSLMGVTDAVRPSISDANLPQATKKAHDFNQQKTGPPLLGADWITMTSCDQDEEEEEDVDILLFSPEKDSLTQVCEVGLSDMVLTPDEEGEEDDDGNEIDVTGDEEAE